MVLRVPTTSGTTSGPSLNEKCSEAADSHQPAAVEPTLTRRALLACPVAPALLSLPAQAGAHPEAAPSTQETAVGKMAEHRGSLVHASQALTSGITDHSILLQAIFDSAPEGSQLVLPRGTVYRLLSTIELSKGIEVVAEGVIFSVGANVTPFSFDAGVGDVVPLTADYALNDTVINVEAMSRALRRGEPFKIVSNAVDPGNRDQGSLPAQYRVGEWAHAGASRVPKASDDDPNSYSTTTLIRLRTPLQMSIGVSPLSNAGDEPLVPAYTQALNARVVTMSGKSLKWTGGTIEFDAEHGFTDPWAAGCMIIMGYYRPEIRNLTIKRGYRGGLNLTGCYRPLVENCIITGLQDDITQSQLGYGIADASYYTRVDNCIFGEVRHGYTTTEFTSNTNLTGTSLLGMGRVVGARISFCEGYGGNGGVFDTHQGAEDISFVHCTASDAAGSGFGLRGRRITLVSPKVRNCLAGIVVATEFNGGDPDDDLYVAGKPLGLTTCRITDADIECAGVAIQASAVRELVIAGTTRIQTASTQTIRSLGSRTVIDGSLRVRMTDFQGIHPINTTKFHSIIDVSSPPDIINADFAGGLIVTSGSYVEIDARAAKSGGPLYAFAPETNTVSLRKSNAAYFTGQNMRVAHLPGAVFVCVTTGKTASTQPLIYTDMLKNGDEVADGTAVFRARANGIFNIEGRIKLMLTPVFSQPVFSSLMDQFVCGDEGVIEYSVEGALTNTLSLSGPNTISGKPIRIRGLDGAMYYDGTGIGKPYTSENLFFADINVNVTHLGTGLATNDVYQAAHSAVPAFVDLGYYHRIEYVISKHGTAGAANIACGFGEIINHDVPVPANAALIRLEVEMFATDETARLCFVTARAWDDTGSEVALTKTGQLTQRSINNGGSGGAINRIGMTAALGDSLTIRTHKVYGYVGGYGL